jgi:hypothetical protein
MARNDFTIGDATAIGITTNIAGTTQSWGATANTLRYFKTMQGQGNITMGREQTPLGDMSIDPPSISTGGQRCSGSFQLPLSSVYDEGLFSLISCDDDTIDGAGPYTHTFVCTDRLKYGTLVYYWENYKGTRFQLLVTNATVTQLTITQEAGQRPTVTANWVGQKWTASTPGAAPTFIAVEYPDWDDCTLTIGAAALVVKSFTLDIVQPASEDDYGIGSADSPNVVFIGRAGQRATTLTVDAGHDDATQAWLTAGATPIATNTIVWDNGAATTSNRKITITLSSLMASPADQGLAEFGRINTSFTFTAYGATPFGIVSTNALATAEPLAV